MTSLGDIYGEIKDRCQRIAIPADPSIYFIDSQGVGDEQYELEQKEILERVTSLFASVSITIH